MELNMQRITSRLNRCAKDAQLGQLTARFARVNCHLAQRYKEKNEN